MKKLLTVGALAREAGLNPSAVRYYETHRVIPRAPRLPNGYRVYSPDAVNWLRFVRRAQAFGMRLEEIKELLRLAVNGQTPCGRVRELARRHLEQIERNLLELQALREQLLHLLRQRARRFRSTQICPLIENVSSTKRA
jgi:DNA-binding transcriptional MerR regulator